MILKCLLYFLEMRDQFYAAAQQNFVWRRFFALSYFAAMQYAHSRWTNPVTAADIAADLTTKGPEFDHNDATADGIRPLSAVGCARLCGAPAAPGPREREHRWRRRK
jgi:hypothetical protein